MRKKEGKKDCVPLRDNSQRKKEKLQRRKERRCLCIRVHVKVIDTWARDGEGEREGRKISREIKKGRHNIALDTKSHTSLTKG